MAVWSLVRLAHVILGERWLYKMKGNKLSGSVGVIAAVSAIGAVGVSFAGCLIYRGIKSIFEEYFDNAYDAGENNGYEEGHAEGYEEGRKNGLEAGYVDGHGEGYDSGFDDGYDRGFADCLCGFTYNGNSVNLQDVVDYYHYRCVVNSEEKSAENVADGSAGDKVEEKPEEQPT